MGMIISTAETSITFFCAILFYEYRVWEPVILMMIFACTSAVCLLYFIMPESPKFLIIKRRKEDAEAVFNFI